MPVSIEFGNTCTCAKPCRGAVCWRPAQQELAQLLDTWRLRNPSPHYQVRSDAPRHVERPLRWNPRRRALWKLLAAAGAWQQTYAVEEERIFVRQVLADGREEHFTVEPETRAVPEHLVALQPVALV